MAMLYQLIQPRTTGGGGQGVGSLLLSPFVHLLSTAHHLSPFSCPSSSFAPFLLSTLSLVSFLPTHASFIPPRHLSSFPPTPHFLSPAPLLLPITHQRLSPVPCLLSTTPKPCPAPHIGQNINYVAKLLHLTPRTQATFSYNTRVGVVSQRLLEVTSYRIYMQPFQHKVTTMDPYFQYFADHTPIWVGQG